MNYNIYSGYVGSDNQNNPSKYANKTHSDFFEIWFLNTRRYYPQAAIYIQGPDKPNLEGKHNICSIAEYANLGHVDDYIYGKRVGKWCGAVAGMIYGMMHAYLQDVDFVYKEQDCLIVGKCIEQMYEEIEEEGIIFGNNKMFGSAQALFLVKRNYIPLMIKQLAEKRDSEVLPEIKFKQLKHSKKFSFGYDRDRPYNKSDKCFYIQQLTEVELNDLQEYKLI